jgi:hypothetical protein
MRVISFTPQTFIPGERAPAIHKICGWVDPRAGLEAVDERKNFALPEIEPGSSIPSPLFLFILFIWFVRLLALRPLLACCASLE